MKFVVVDLSGAVPHADVSAYAAAQQRQLREHYAARYDGDGIDDEVRAADRPNDIQPDEFPIRLRMSSTVPQIQGALGEHALDGADILLDLCQKYGQDWRSTASHEVIEARTDRRLHACIELDDGSIWDKEACDRVEAESYDVDGVPLSNFNTPEAFEPPPAGSPAPSVGGAYDWMGTSTKPNEVRQGGYAQQYTPGQGWQQVGAMRPYRAELAAMGLSRGAKRKARAAA